MSALIDKSAYASGGSGFRLNGTTVLLSLLAFFATVALADGTMIYFALSTFRGEQEVHAYEHGLAYDKDIQAARVQAARDWHVSAHVGRIASDQHQLTVIFHDAQDHPLRGLAVEASLAFATDKKRDHDVALQEIEPGLYRGAFAAAAGLFDLTIDAKSGGKIVFRSRNRLTLDETP